MTEPAERTRTERLLFLLAASFVLVSTILAVRLVLATRAGTADSYYYFARAASLNDGAALRETTLNWAGGVDRKFFPGFPLLLHWVSFGSAPERAWRSLAVVLVLVNPILLGLGLRRLGLGFGAACLAVTLYAANWIPLNWLTMPMAEGTALFWLGLSACALPLREGGPLRSLAHFLLSCALGGMAILARAEAAFPAAALGLVGVSRLRAQASLAHGFRWLPVAALGAVLGVAPFLYWVSSLPTTGQEVSRLHYVNEFLREFSWRDRQDVSGKGGFLENFLRSWWHPIFNWGRLTGFGVFDVPPARDENPLFKLFWLILWIGTAVLGLVGAGGARGRRFALAYIGFVAFRSFWYYPYDRFLATGLPMGFAAAALVVEGAARRGRVLAWIAGLLAALWIARGAESVLRYHSVYRVAENSAHHYRDDKESDRVRYQTDLTFLPLEGADIAELAVRRFTARFESQSVEPRLRAEARRAEVVALEFPWPQIAYALRPRPIVLGYPLENFWGEPDYRRKHEVVPLDAEGKPEREPRRTIEYLQSRGVRYVITPLARTAAEGSGPWDEVWGGWTDFVGLTAAEAARVRLVDVVQERSEESPRWELPRMVRMLAPAYDDR